LAAAMAAAAWAGTFGTVVPIGGHASDLVLDEARGVVYIANFTANRIEVMSTSDFAIRSSLNVAPQPDALALSPDGQYLLVAHYGTWQSPNTNKNALTVVNLNDNTRQTFALGYPPLGVAFGADGLALVVTTTDLLLFDPVSGATQVLKSVS
jgi:DNA-binding beta-propeller fold protein YncE